MKISILIPVYNGAKTIREALNSIFEQEFVTLHRDLEVIISDNNSEDSTVKEISKFNDKRIKLIRQRNFIPFVENIRECITNATGDILIFLSANDVLLNSSIYNIYEAFQNEKVGLVTRPYYFFYTNPNKPIRYTRQLKTINGLDSKLYVLYQLETLGQMSGIAVRKAFIDPTKLSSLHFIEFTSMVFPLIFTHGVSVMYKPSVAIRSDKSGSMEKRCYKNSPSSNWYFLLDNCLPKNDLQKYLIKHFIARNYVGLVTVRAYGGLDAFFREIKYLDKLHYKFWLYAPLLLLTPSIILRCVILKWKKIKTSF